MQRFKDFPFWIVANLRQVYDLFMAFPVIKEFALNKLNVPTYFDEATFVILSSIKLI